MTDPSPLDDDPLLGRTLLGRYLVRRVLGEGGMGRVYLAEQKMGQASREVAVKTLHPELVRDPQIVARFHRECATVIELTHPNTVQFYDFGELEDGTLFIVMEYIRGESLARALERGAMTPERVDRLLIQIAGSLHEAHQRGVVHRDLKPENVLLTERGGTPDFVKVLDFGIAKRSEAEDDQSAKLTKQGMVLGTPPYMSPEQFSGQTLDARSDIYSLGVMTYEMLVGRLPFDGRTPWEWATKHLTEQPAPIESFPTGSMLAPQKRGAVMRALEKDRARRQPDVLTFLRDFTGIDDPAAAWTVATSLAGGAGAGASVPAPARGPVGTPGPMTATPAHPTPGGRGEPATSGMHPASVGSATPGAWPTPVGPTTSAGAGGGAGKWILLGLVAFVLVVGGAGAGVWWVASQRRAEAVAARPAGPVVAEPAPPVSPTPPAGAELPQGVTPAGADSPSDPAGPTAADRPPAAAEEPDPDPEPTREPDPSPEPEPVARDDEGAREDARTGPGASARRRASALVERGTRALDGNDVSGAASALAAAQRLVGRRDGDVRALRAQLGRKASRKIGILLQQGKCPEAQALYRSLARAGAAGPSQVHFSDWCPRP